MSNLNTKDIEISEIFKIYIEKQIGASDLAEKIEDAMFELINYRLTDENYTGHPDGYDVIYFLRDLKDICIGNPSKFKHFGIDVQGLHT